MNDFDHPINIQNEHSLAEDEKVRVNKFALQFNEVMYVEFMEK